MPADSVNGTFKMKHALSRHRRLLRAGHPRLMPVSKRYLRDALDLGACMEAAE